MTQWTRQDAIELCIAIEAVCPQFGCHVALTGGCLYKPGERKDADILFYRIRQVEHIDTEGLFAALAKLGIERVTQGVHWCVKARYHGRTLDLFFPETEAHDEYPRA